MNKIQVVDKREVLEFEFRTYGYIENPLFLMLKKIDEEEKMSLTSQNNACGDQKVVGLTDTLGGVQESNHYIQCI